jgi:hypothetical protein
MINLEKKAPKRPPKGADPENMPSAVVRAMLILKIR